MTVKQQVFRMFYPLVKRLANRKHAAGKLFENVDNATPMQSFHELTAIQPDGKSFSFESLKGKKVLIVNTASHCGYTPQYEELEQLFQARKSDLLVLGFPSNDFKGQEPGTDEEIASFCKINYGISFPLFKKDSVLNPSFQQVYRWLTDKRLNGWNERPPVWNFSKYLIDEEGVLQGFYGPEISPLDISLK